MGMARRETVDSTDCAGNVYGIFYYDWALCARLETFTAWQRKHGMRLYVVIGSKIQDET